MTTIGHGLPVPAMTPLRPAVLRPIVAGEVWTKRASQRNSDKRPTVKVWSFTGGKVSYQLDGGRGPFNTQTERTFRRDWE